MKTHSYLGIGLLLTLLAAHATAAPTLTINEPRVGTVARPTFPIEITGSSTPSGDTVIGVYCGKEILAWGTNSIHGSAQIPNGNGPTATLTIEAIDLAGQSTLVNRDLYVLTSTNWVEACSADGPILDHNATTILYLDDRALVSQSRSSGTKTVLVNQPNLQPVTAALTPSGVLFQTADDQICELRNGVLTNLWSGKDLVFRDNYAVWFVPWASSFSYAFSDFGANLITAVPSFAQQLTLGPNGSYACVAGQTRLLASEVWLARNGVLKKIAASESFEYFNPQTDGSNVLYGKRSLALSSTNILRFVALFDGTSETIIATNFNFPSVYTINAGWVAFANADKSGTQVWTRSPSGKFEQRSPSGVSSTLVALAPNGQVLFSNQGKLYLAREGWPPRDLGLWSFASTNVFWKNGKWQCCLGRSLFELHTPLALRLSGGPKEGYKITAQAQPETQLTLQLSTNLLKWFDLATTNTTEATDVEFLDSTTSTARFFRILAK